MLSDFGKAVRRGLSLPCSGCSNARKVIPTTGAYAGPLVAEKVCDSVNLCDTASFRRIGELHSSACGCLLCVHVSDFIGWLQEKEKQKYVGHGVQ